MDAEFALAKKRQEREREQLLKQRQAKLEREQRGQAEFAKAEQHRLEQVEARLAAERRRVAREELEELNSGGIRLVEFLKPLPMANLETDRIRLPSSFLQRLTDLGGIRGGGDVLGFELCLVDELSGEVTAKTHAGVLEFVAQEGTVELPVKVVLSLTKDMGESVLGNGRRVRVRLVQIDHSDQVRVKIQPKGEGFHLNDQEVVQLDLKSVLTRVLKQQTAISVGDLIPLRHEGRTFVLNVRELWPESPALLINTDLEVDMMPCENVELRALELERQAKAQEQWTARRLELEAGLPQEAVIPAASVVAFKARIPGVSNAVPSRKFDKHAHVTRHVFDWAYSTLPSPPPTHTAELEIVLGPGKTLRASSTQTLSDAGLGSPQALNFRWALVEPEATPSPVASVAVAMEEEWLASRANAETHLDKDLDAMQDVEGEESQQDQDEAMSKVDLFKLLVACGAAPPAQAAAIAQRYHACLLAVHRLGLLQPGSGQLVMDLVDKFKGSIERVADGIAQQQQQAVQPTATPSPPPPSSPDYSAQIQLLQATFTECTQQDILHVLIKYHGNVERAANALLTLT